MAKSPKQFLAEFGNRVSIVTNKVAISNDTVLTKGSDFYLQPNAGIYANGNFGYPGQVLTSTGSSVYWAAGGGGGGGSVNTDAQYTWTNNHIFVKGLNSGTDSIPGNISISDGTGIYGGIFGGQDTGKPFLAFGIPQGPVLISKATGTQYNFYLPPTKGTKGQFLTTDGNGITSWIDGSSASVNTAAQYTWTNNHTFDKKIIFNNTDATDGMLSINGVSYSLISQYVNGVGVGGWYSYPTTTSFGTTKGTLTIATDGTVAVSSNGISFLFPKVAGTAGQLLSTDGNGNTSWVGAGAGSVNTAAQYTWTNTHTFNAKVAYNNLDAGANSIVFSGSANAMLTHNIGGNPVGSWFSFPSLTAIGTTRGYIQFLTGTGAGGASVLTNNANVNFTFPASNGTAGQVLSTDGTGKTSWITTGAGGVNTSAEYTWTNNHTFNDKVTINNTDATDGMLSINGVSYSLISQYVNGAPVGGWYSYPSFTAIGTTKGQFRVTLADGSAGVSSRSNTAYFGFPASNGTSGQVLSTDGSGVTSWITVSPGGGVNTSAKYTWTNTHTFNNTDTVSGLQVNGVSYSIISEYVNGSAVGSWYSYPTYTIFGTVNGSIHITTSGTITANTTSTKFVFPKTNGASGQVLSTDGTGTTSWISAGGGSGTVTSVSGTGTVSGITLSGSVTTSGSLTLGGTLSVQPTNLSAGAPSWTGAGAVTTTGNITVGSGGAGIVFAQSKSYGVATLGLDTGGVWQLYSTSAAGGAKSIMTQNLSNGNMTITGTYSPASDIKLKENILDINKTEAIEKVRLLQGVTYNKIGNDKNEREMGFIANHVEPIIPELVSESNIAKEGETPNIIKTLNYDGMTAVLCEAVKHLDDENKTLKEELAALRQEVKALLKKQSK